MPESMPLALVIASVFFGGFVNTHERHQRNFKGASRGFLLALQVSLFIGTLVGFGLVIYYFIQVAWYWPILLIVISALVGGLLFGALDTVIGQLNMSMLAFLGWPVAAMWQFYIINTLVKNS